MYWHKVSMVKVWSRLVDKQKSYPSFSRIYDVGYQILDPQTGRVLPSVHNLRRPRKTQGKKLAGRFEFPSFYQCLDHPGSLDRSECGPEPEWGQANPEGGLLLIFGHSFGIFWQTATGSEEWEKVPIRSPSGDLRSPAAAAGWPIHVDLGRACLQDEKQVPTWVWEKEKKPTDPNRFLDFTGSLDWQNIGASGRNCRRGANWFPGSTGTAVHPGDQPVCSLWPAALLSRWWRPGSQNSAPPRPRRQTFGQQWSSCLQAL